MAPNSSLASELEQRLQGLRHVLTRELPDQIRQGTVEPSLWYGAHEADAWLSGNRFRLPAVLATAFAELLRWFMTDSNAFLAWLREAIEAGRHGDPRVERELQYRIEQLWTMYDQKAFAVMRIGLAATSAGSLESSTRILFLASNPANTTALDLQEEVRSLELELRAVRYRDEIQLIQRHAVRPDDLVRFLRQDSPTIVHFSGHGLRTGIVLRTEAAHAVVPGDALRRLFRDRGVQLVVLNACFSNDQASSLAGVVPAVVGATEAVDDEAARRFSTAFYRTLGDGHQIGDAFRDGGDAVAVHALKDVFCSYGRLDRVMLGHGAAQQQGAAPDVAHPPFGRSGPRS